MRECRHCNAASLSRTRLLLFAEHKIDRTAPRSDRPLMSAWRMLSDEIPRVCKVVWTEASA